jgi:phosphoglycerol transferase MdoB-like AlkP superfamily enzyme
MLRLLLLIIGGGISVFLIALMIRYMLKVSFAWDSRMCTKLKRSFCGFRRHLRMPTAIGVVPEFFYFMVLGRENYFNARWWALRAASYISFLLFLAALFSRSTVENYYSWSYLGENGLTAYFTGSGMWYLNMINFFFLGLIAMILIESILMHKAWAPVRFIMYTFLSLCMAYISVITIALIIAITFLYVCYKIIRFFMSSGRNTKVEVDNDDGVSDKLNNTYRQFRAELYEWETERKNDRKARRDEKKTVIKRRKPRIERKPRSVHKNNDIPRIHPE